MKMIVDEVRQRMALYDGFGNPEMIATDVVGLPVLNQEQKEAWVRDSDARTAHIGGLLQHIGQEHSYFMAQVYVTLQKGQAEARLGPDSVAVVTEAEWNEMVAEQARMQQTTLFTGITLLVEMGLLQWASPEQTTEEQP